ncbi:MAG TPA: hypothetical protein PLB62_14735, partial [Candidatus Sumerlaeota bacterium]|nr:hypothetical protein [Candidatus Sumerlaeota bacterium]
MSLVIKGQPFGMGDDNTYVPVRAQTCAEFLLPRRLVCNLENDEKRSDDNDALLVQGSLNIE